MHQIQWGIIGCGDVTEVKSGPAFNRVPQSKLAAVMRRDEEKLKDYAKRHHVPKYYTDATTLINDPDINAVYIATPPHLHKEYALAAIAAGKPVYVEKPMCLNHKEAVEMVAAAATANVKMVIAHYRRQQPLFLKLKEIIQAGAIGVPKTVRLYFNRRLLSSEQLQENKTAWRVNKEQAGGGLFHDMAPHQLDILYYLFGSAAKVQGMAINQSGAYSADDAVTAQVLFDNGVLFQGLWSFSLAETADEDSCIIAGDNGEISFNFFGTPRFTLNSGGSETFFEFSVLQHVQQPMIEKVVQHFLGNAPNPCPADDGAAIMQWMDVITK